MIASTITTVLTCGDAREAAAACAVASDVVVTVRSPRSLRTSRGGGRSPRRVSAIVSRTRWACAGAGAVAARRAAIVRRRIRVMR